MLDKIKLDIVDVILGLCLLILVVAFAFGHATFDEVLFFATLFVFKKVPANINKEGGYK